MARLMPLVPAGGLAAGPPSPLLSHGGMSVLSVDREIL